MRGVIEVVVPVDEIETRMERSAASLGIGVAVGFILLIGIVGWMLRGIVLKPINDLQQATQAVSEVDLEV